VALTAYSPDAPRGPSSYNSQLASGAAVEEGGMREGPCLPATGAKSSVRYLGIEVDDALAISEQVEL